jgi:hypothetical protein
MSYLSEIVQRTKGKMSGSVRRYEGRVSLLCYTTVSRAWPMKSPISVEELELQKECPRPFAFSFFPGPALNLDIVREGELS